jgi:hypothetical protein
MDDDISHMENLEVLSIITSSGYSDAIFSLLPQSLSHLQISVAPSEDCLLSLLCEKAACPNLKSILLFPNEGDHKELWWLPGVQAANDVGVHFQIIPKFSGLHIGLELLEDNFALWL